MSLDGGAWICSVHSLSFIFWAFLFGNRCICGSFSGRFRFRIEKVQFCICFALDKKCLCFGLVDVVDISKLFQLGKWLSLRMWKKEKQTFFYDFEKAIKVDILNANYICGVPLIQYIFRFFIYDIHCWRCGAYWLVLRKNFSGRIFF